MTGTVESLVAEALQLPADQRFTLAYRILSSVEPTVAPEIEEAWDAEIRARIVRYDTGQVSGVPAAEVFAEADRRLRQ